MTTITIPKNLIDEKDLIVLPRLQYENLLKYITHTEAHDYLWQDASKDIFLKTYNKADSVYDQV